MVTSRRSSSCPSIRRWLPVNSRCSTSPVPAKAPATTSISSSVFALLTPVLSPSLFCACTTPIAAFATTINSAKRENKLSNTYNPNVKIGGGTVCQEQSGNQEDKQTRTDTLALPTHPVWPIALQRGRSPGSRRPIAMYWQLSLPSRSACLNLFSGV